MDSSRQLIRYSIPGGVFLLLVVFNQVLLDHARGVDLTRLPSSLTPSGTVAILAASVPVGFIVYQFYYRWYGPFRWWGLVVTRDVGARVLGGPPQETRAGIERILNIPLTPEAQLSRTVSLGGPSWFRDLLHFHKLGARAPKGGAEEGVQGGAGRQRRGLQGGLEGRKGAIRIKFRAGDDRRRSGG